MAQTTELVPVTTEKVAELVEKIKALGWIEEVRSSSAYIDYVAIGFDYTVETAGEFGLTPPEAEAALKAQFADRKAAVAALVEKWVEETGWEFSVGGPIGCISLTLQAGPILTTNGSLRMPNA